MASSGYSVSALMGTLILLVLPVKSYSYGFIKLKAQEASESDVFLTKAVVKFEMCPPDEILNTTCNQEFAAVQAQFGPPSEGEIVGNYRTVTPRDACDDVQSVDDWDSFTSYPVIALISKGNCSFDTKVSNAERAGFHAAIIYVLKEDVSLFEITSSIPSVPVTIPAFYVSHATGTVLVYTSIVSNSTRSVLLSISTQELSVSKGGVASNLRPVKKVGDDKKGRIGDNGREADVKGDSNFGERYFHICIYIWACVVVSILIALSIKWGCCSRPLTRWEVRKIPLKRFRRSEGFEYQDKCPICHEEFREGYLVRQLPCNHCYHSYCVDKWLVKMSNRCPLCKQRVSVSLLCSWDKQHNRENLTQSAAEAEAEASAGELPPLPPIQSLTPSSLYGEAIMSGPSKFIIMRPGRPTRIIEVQKKEEGSSKIKTITTCITRSEKDDSQSVPDEESPPPPPTADSTTCQQIPEGEQHSQSPATGGNDVIVQLSQTQTSPPSESLPMRGRFHLELEDLNTVERDDSPGQTSSSSSSSLLDDEMSGGHVASVHHSSSDATMTTCECEDIHKLWLNKPDEDVVSPLLNSESNSSNECAITCTRCSNSSQFPRFNDSADDRIDNQSSQAFLLSSSLTLPTTSAEDVNNCAAI